MELVDFRAGSFLSGPMGLGKVVRDDEEEITLLYKDGFVGKTEKVSRVLLSMGYFSKLKCFRRVSDNCFMLLGIPGSFTYNFYEITFEWDVMGMNIRYFDYLDEVQLLYFCCTGEELFEGNE